MELTMEAYVAGQVYIEHLPGRTFRRWTVARVVGGEGRGRSSIKVEFSVETGDGRLTSKTLTSKEIKDLDLRESRQETAKAAVNGDANAAKKRREDEEAEEKKRREDEEEKKRREDEEEKKRRDAGFFLESGVWLVKRPGAKFAGGCVKKRKLLITDDTTTP